MNFRLATVDDLPQLQAVYKRIIDNMNRNNICIWDDIYPCSFFQNDIENSRLYVLEDNSVIVSAFALCDSNPGVKYLDWAYKKAKALYIDRFGVNVDYLRKGIGRLMLDNAFSLAQKMKVDYLRLFVVNINTPAISLYTKNGYSRVNGTYDEKINENLTLHEFGYEIKIGTSLV